jgi:hypothetical protein
MRVSFGVAVAGCPLVLAAIALTGICSTDRLTRAGPSPRAKAAALGDLPLSFEKNDGQMNPSAKFVARQSAADIFLTEDGLALALKDPPPDPVRGSAIRQRPGVVRMEWSGGRATEIVGMAELPGKANYLRGRDRSGWRTGIRTYAKVKYSNLYPGIDLVYYGNQSRLEYDFIVAPGANANAIRVALKGADGVVVGEGGELVLRVGDRTVTQLPPRVYQEVDGERREISGGYVLVADRELAFRLGAYDRRNRLVIDPVLEFSTYLGGSRYDYARGIALDSEGNIYLAGQTSSTDFETTDSAFQQTYAGGAADAFVMKLSADGLRALYSTYLGGTDEDVAYGVGVDRWGQACLTGYTRSSDFPTVNALQENPGGESGDFDAFVAKLNAEGNGLIYSTYLGGSDADSGRAIAVDPDGSAYIAGSTSSRDFPVVNAYQPTFGGPMADAFVARLNADGSEYVYVTYLGGRLYDAAFGIAADTDGNAFVVGTTSSPDFPTREAIYSEIGGGGGESGNFNAFLAKFYWDGSLIYSTFLGGSVVDAARAVAVDFWGNAYVTGETQSSDFPTVNAFQREYGGSVDAFVTMVNVEGTALVYSTYLGGSRMEQGYGIAVDQSGLATVTGSTSSTDFPTANPIQEQNHGAEDVFVSCLGADGSALVYSTYLGGQGPDVAFAVAVDAAGDAYIAGSTTSADFPTWNSFQADLHGFGNGFAAKLGADQPALSRPPAGARP